ncbi:alpha-amylase family glycosyl hydrolase [Ideonella sp. A 288]|uniref:alpha-amylase family glycosyl hydrolase n=1 Tax=Ideonella sp. A 288 TaxID=1962181 RepID=UPI000B4B6F9D|nr:alpha-amylase family glycosyl hydrolase [Ideonella sp. A 288]
MSPLLPSAGGLALVALLAGCAAAPAPVAIDTTAVPALRQASPLQEHWHRGAFMEIFVRAYQDSDGDGVGDLPGLISRLDHLRDLGVKGLWLMPVTASADRDHGYATTDFRAIERDYGTLADFDELLRQAHARGIGVIIDYVVNHSAAEHPMFVQARGDAVSPWRDWFVWSDAAPQGWDIWGKNPWYHAGSRPWQFKGDPKDWPAPPPQARSFYFGTFGPHMPDFNFRRREVLDYHLDSLRFWLNRGLDGFRLDAVPHLVETDARQWNDQPESRRLAKVFQDLILSYPNRYVVCEATAAPQDYGRPEVCGGAFAFGQVQHYVGAARGQAESVKALADFYRRASPTMATFVSSHDIFAGRRLWDQVGGDIAQYKLAAAGYLLQPGTPFIYYGEEVGQAGVPGLRGDRPLRAPMSWTPDRATAGFTTGLPFRPVAPNLALQNVQAQSREPGSILAFYRAMLALRNTLPSIARGSFEHSFADGLVLGFQRHLREGALDDRTLVLVNYGSTPAQAGVSGLPAGARLTAAYPESDASVRADAGGSAQLPLAPQSVQVWRVGGR